MYLKNQISVCVWQMCLYVQKCRRCACSHSKATTSFRVFWCVNDISVWWVELHSGWSVVCVCGGGPLCGAVTGVNPKLSHQHPHGLLSLKCAGTHTSYSLGENGKWRPEAGAEVGGVRWREKQDAAEEAVFCELSSHYWGFGRALRMTALGPFFISLTLFLVNLFSKHVSVWLTRDVKSLQTNNMAICSSSIAGFHFFHSFSHRSAVMTDCVMVIEPGCGWWGGYQPSQLETPQLLDWLQCLKEDPDEGTMSLFHSWAEGWGPHANLQI